MNILRKVLAGTALAGVLSCMAGASSAATLISIGLGASPATVASGSTSALFSGPSGGFSAINVTGQLGLDPVILFGNTIDLAANAAGTLYVWITATGLTSPTGIQHLLSSTTENSLTNGWSVVAKTFYDPNNAAYGTTDPLASHTATGIGTFGPADAGAFNLANPFSVTEEYIITASGRGGANSTIDISSAVPEPVTWGMMLFGIGMAGAALRSQRKRNASVAFA